MKTFTQVKGLLTFVVFALLFNKNAAAQPAVTLNPASTQNVTAGATINFTAQRNSNSQNWTGGNSQFTFTWSSSPAGVTFTNNPNTVNGTSSSTVASFPTTGTYQISCLVQEGGGGLNATSVATTVNVSTPVPANIWATSSNGTQISGFAVSNGTYQSGPNNIFAPTFPGGTTGGSSTAALGRSAFPSLNLGHFYWLPNTAGNNGVVEIFAATSTGANVTRVASFDVNGAGNNTSLGFVRLGMGPDGTGWILAGDGTTLFLAKFISNGVNPVTVTIEDASVNLVGGAVSTFQNGDLCISGSGTIYALANDGNGVTQIFIGAPTGANTTLTKRWDLVTPGGGNFSGTVNGVAFDVLGSIYISTGAGLYYINQNTANGPAGTVQCSLVVAMTGLQDLASNVFPAQSTLPVTLLNFSAAYRNGVTVLNWETENEVNFSHYEVERKTESGADYIIVDSKQANGNAGRSAYTSSDNISSLTDGVVYYRLRMVDVDGKFKYSNVIMVRKEKKTITGISLSPNPVISTANATVRFEAASNAVVSLRVMDMAGRQVLAQQNNVTGGTNSIQVNNLNRLQPGLYIIQLVNGNELSSFKFSVVQ
ncbi:MAG TPA: T9SS type A sorting domain-containing protein [Chitinophagaceae bacterium]|nr:T9SS type A sorting domain-containing protein [Chitinophagaceae bacterium]HPH31602.1 T9SS type A sorting domain-containing protein [Chitinophagaceae bacterium]HPN57929.1 T9SS type A sorting domain-containing protein [Chitinophagaceae bacterium]